MEQQDYLQRQIDQLGRVLGKVLLDLFGFKSQGQMNAGIEMTNQAIKGELDLDIQDILGIPTARFIDMLTTHKHLTNDNLHKLAEILLFIADNKQNDNKELYEKCLTIYEYLEKVENVYSLDRQWKIQQLKNIHKL